MTKRWLRLPTQLGRARHLAALVALLPGSAFGASIEIGSARAAPGDRVEIVGVLHTGDVDLFGAAVDFSFPPSVSVPARASGRPQCDSLCRSDYASPGDAAGDDAGGAAKSCSGVSFAFRPPGCTPGVDCTTVRALELALDVSDPFPDPAYLFVCTLAVAPDAPLGPQALACANPNAADREGVAHDTTCTDGVVDIVCPGDCNGDERVTVNELVTGIRLLQGEGALEECASSDADGNGGVAITDLVRARNTLLSGCRPPLR